MELEQKFIEKIKHLGTEERFNMGDVIIKEGEKADKVYVVISGHASVFKKSPGGEEIFLGLAGAGSVLGEMGLFLEGERTATVRAASNLTALVFDNEEFIKAVSEIPELAYKVIKEFSKRVNNLNRRIINVVTSKLMYVVGMYLLENVKMEESLYYQPEEGTVEIYIRKFATEYSMEPSKVESIILTMQKAGVIHLERSETTDEFGKQEIMYKIRFNPEKLKAYLRSIAHV